MEEEYIRFEMTTGDNKKVIILIPMDISEDELKEVGLFLEKAGSIIKNIP